MGQDRPGDGVGFHFLPSGAIYRRTALAFDDMGKSTTVNGWVSDSKCGAKGANAKAEACTKKCITGGAKAVLVNDADGNPIEIAAVVVWRVEDSAQAMFDVDNYENYVPIQSESALRHLASLYAYDHSEEDTEITLRSSVRGVRISGTPPLPRRAPGRRAVRLAGTGLRRAPESSRAHRYA